MFLKDHLKDTYRKSSFDKNHLMVENITNRWVHRFGIESLNELVVNNQDQIKLIEEDKGQENKKQINFELLKNVHYKKDNDFKSKTKNKLNKTEVIDKYNYGFNKNKETEELPLPNINNLRRWINKENKAS